MAAHPRMAWIYRGVLLVAANLGWHRATRGFPRSVIIFRQRKNPAA